MHRLGVLSHSFARGEHSRYLLAVDKVIRYSMEVLVIRTSRAFARVRPAIPPPAMITLRVFAMAQRSVLNIGDVENRIRESIM
jgi:hypothetical protein